jgi:microcystin-dependent protein
VKSTTSMSAQGINISTNINTGVPTSGLFIGQGSGTIPYVLPDSGGAVLTWNTVKSLNSGGTENGNFEMVIGSGAVNNGNLRIYNTIGAGGTTANQNTMTLTRTGNLSLLGGITATTGYFSSGTTVVGALSTNTLQQASGGIVTVSAGSGTAFFDLTDTPVGNTGPTGRFTTNQIVAKNFIGTNAAYNSTTGWNVVNTSFAGMFLRAPDSTGSATKTELSLVKQNAAGSQSFLIFDTANNRMGVMNPSPATTLDVIGTAQMSGLLTAQSGISTNTIQPFSGNTFNLATNGSVVNIGNSGSTLGIVANQFLSARNGLYVGGNYGIQIAGTSGLITPGPTGSGAAFGYNTREPGGANLELAIGRGGVAAGGGLNIFNTTVTGNTGVSKIFALDNTGTLTLAGGLTGSTVSTTNIVATGVNNELYIKNGMSSLILVPTIRNTSNFNANTQVGDAALSYTGSVMTIGSNNSPSSAGAIRLLQNGNIQNWSLLTNGASTPTNILSLNVAGLNVIGGTTSYGSNRFIEFSTTNAINGAGGSYVAAPGIRLKGGNLQWGAPLTTNSYGASIEIDGARSALAGQNNGQIRFYTGAQANNMTLDENGNLNVAGAITAGSISAVPVGTIMMYAMAAAPTGGWVVCDGTGLSTTGTFAALFSVLGYTYGGSGGTFNVPDMRSRVPVGAGQGSGSGLSNYNIGWTGGVESVTLVGTNMPAHNHGVTDPGHNHRFTDFWGVGSATGAAKKAISHNTTGSDASVPSNTVPTGISLQNAYGNGSGGADAHENRQPYIVINYIIKF